MRGRKKSEAMPANVVTDVKELPENLRAQVESMLVDGSTIEDVVEALAEAGPCVTLSAVRNYYRENPELAKQRIMHLVEKAEELKAKLREAKPGKNPIELDVTNAWLLTGLQFLNRSDIRYTLRDAVNMELRQENLNLRRQMNEQDSIERQRVHILEDARIQTELERSKLLRLKVEELQRAFEHDGRGAGPELVARIQEIYGLANQTGEAAQEGEKAKA